MRNLIAREYADDEMREIHAAAARLAPVLLSVVPKVSAYADDLVRRFSGPELTP